MFIFLLFVLHKTGDLLLELVLTKFLEWVLSDEHLKRVSIALKLQLLVLFLDWVLQKTPLRDLPEQQNLDSEPEQPEEPGK
jgi:hypothetical protein